MSRGVAVIAMDVGSHRETSSSMFFISHVFMNRLDTLLVTHSRERGTNQLTGREIECLTGRRAARARKQSHFYSTARARQCISIFRMLSRSSTPPIELARLPSPALVDWSACGKQDVLKLGRTPAVSGGVPITRCLPLEQAVLRDPVGNLHTVGAASVRGFAELPERAGPPGWVRLHMYG